MCRNRFIFYDSSDPTALPIGDINILYNLRSWYKDLCTVLQDPFVKIHNYKKIAIKISSNNTLKKFDDLDLGPSPNNFEQRSRIFIHMVSTSLCYTMKLHINNCYNANIEVCTSTFSSNSPKSSSVHILVVNERV